MANEKFPKKREKQPSFPYGGNWPSCLTDLLSMRLVGAVKARNNVRSLFSQWELSVTKT